MMGLWKWIQGRGDPLEGVRKAVRQERWADALSAGGILQGTGLDASLRAELDRLLAAAGNGLAQLNLAEGEACLQAADTARAAEHFELAASQACSEALRREAEAALAGLHDSSNGAAGNAPAGCRPGFCPAADQPDPRGVGYQGQESEELDPESRAELIAALYPPEWAERYRDLQGTLRQAFLLSHEGSEVEALEAFGKVESGGRDDLYYFERGSLCARLGLADRARADLHQALALNPGHSMAMEAICLLEIFLGEENRAAERLERMLEQGISEAFCHAQLAGVAARSGESAAALEHGLASLRLGVTDATVLLLTASLLEAAGRFAEAEALLGHLPAVRGCRGGCNLALAEFWLRRGEHLDRALDAFKGELRQDPQNPRWPLRIAQVYAAKGWIREGIPLLEKALADPQLEPDLREEGAALLRASR